MGFFSKLFRRVAKDPHAWPNHPSWSALKTDRVTQPEGTWQLWTVDCGSLYLPSGRLVACDPFTCLEHDGMPFVLTPKGKFPVVVTLADVSEKQDKSHVREAYASIIFADVRECRREAIPLLMDGEGPPKLEEGEFQGFGVDAGTACFVDETVIGPCMPDPDTWSDEVFDNDKPDGWFKLMDNPDHIREGIANVRLPLGRNGENLILFHSGWGDGHFAVIGSFDAQGGLVAAHIDFNVITA